MKKLFAPLMLCLFFSSTATAGLFEYIKKKDPAFQWKLKKKQDLSAMGKVYHFNLISQKWQGITWKHDLLLFLPKGISKPSTMLILNTGGRPRMRHYYFAFFMAKKMGLPLAVLFQIPNQPLFGGKREDGLIAETFVRYIKTKDENWPLLFPMVKSVVRSMDVLQAFSEKEWGKKVESFIITGSSKRGWTTWLTGACDPRVKAIAPMVIDTLNMAKQMEHQRKSYGVVSSQLKDYKQRGILDLLHTLKAKRLLEMIDPYSYRDRLTMPKLILNGTNDPYWVVDSLNLYWKDLKGDKWILYVPNAGHGLRQRMKDGSRSSTRAMNGLAAFGRHIGTNTPLPLITWHFRRSEKGVNLSTHSYPAPLGGRIWIAHSDRRDFRKSRWTSIPLNVAECLTTGRVDTPAKGYRACFVELDFKIGDIPYHLSTQMVVLKGK